MAGHEEGNADAFVAPEGSPIFAKGTTVQMAWRPVT